MTREGLVSDGKRERWRVVYRLLHSQRDQIHIYMGASVSISIDGDNVEYPRGDEPAP
jgi:hypothetical protein